jgi:hypothetical protein
MAARVLAALFLFSLLAACDQSMSDPAVSVERYLTAKATGDRQILQRLLCSAMQDEIEREVRSFSGVSQAHLEGMDCRKDGDGSIVRCRGKIVAAYGTERSEFPLGAYRVTWEDGEWKWCGETR